MGFPEEAVGMTRTGSLGSARGSARCERAAQSRPRSRGVGTAALQRGSVSPGPAALATLRPCELLPVGALSRGSRGTRGGLELGMKPPAG